MFELVIDLNEAKDDYTDLPPAPNENEVELDIKADGVNPGDGMIVKIYSFKDKRTLGAKNKPDGSAHD